MSTAEGHGHPTALRALSTLRRHKWIVIVTTVVVAGLSIFLAMQQTAQYQASATVLLKFQNLASGLHGHPGSLDRLPGSGPDRADPDADRDVSRRRRPRDPEGRRSRPHSPRVPRPRIRHRRGRLRRARFPGHLHRPGRRRAARHRARTTVHRAPPPARYRITRGSTHRASGPDRGVEQQRVREPRTVGKRSRTSSSCGRWRLFRPQTPRFFGRRMERPSRAAGEAERVLGDRSRPDARHRLASPATRSTPGARSADDVGDESGSLLLARLPAPRKKLRTTNTLVMMADPRGHQSEAFRMLRSNLEFVNLDRGARSILGTSASRRRASRPPSRTSPSPSPAPASGSSSSISTCVARLCASSSGSTKHSRVSRTWCSARRPSSRPSSTCSTPRSRAASMACSALTNGNGKTRPPRRPAASWPCSSQEPRPPIRASSSARHGVQSVAELAVRFDVVHIHTPPLLSVGDAMTLSAHVDGMIAVARLELLKRPVLQELSRALGPARRSSSATSSPAPRSSRDTDRPGTKYYDRGEGYADQPADTGGEQGEGLKRVAHSVKVDRPVEPASVPDLEPWANEAAAEAAARTTA